MTNRHTHSETQTRVQTYRMAHSQVEFVLVETFVDCTATSLHITTESLSVITACQEHRTIFVVVVGL